MLVKSIIAATREAAAGGEDEEKSPLSDSPQSTGRRAPTSKVALDTIFSSIDQVPLACASIGQVHRAKLASGEDVVVKLIYPLIRRHMEGDLLDLRFLCAFVNEQLELGMDNLINAIVDELCENFPRELDFRYAWDRWTLVPNSFAFFISNQTVSRLERSNMERAREIIDRRNLGVVIPKCYPQACTVSWYASSVAAVTPLDSQSLFRLFFCNFVCWNHILKDSVLCCEFLEGQTLVKIAQAAEESPKEMDLDTQISGLDITSKNNSSSTNAAAAAIPTASEGGGISSSEGSSANSNGPTEAGSVPKSPSFGRSSEEVQLARTNAKVQELEAKLRATKQKNAESVATLQHQLLLVAEAKKQDEHAKGVASLIQVLSECQKQGI